jgi:hypothetical protein
MLFFFKSYYIYILFLYKFIIKEFIIRITNSFIIKRKKNYKKLEKNKKIKGVYMDKLLIHYYKRHMYYGFSIVYTQIFLRKLKEFKNYYYYYSYYKFKSRYLRFKKRIMSYSILFYFANNYNLALYLDNIKKKIFYINIFFRFYKLYNKTLLKNFFLTFVRYIYLIVFNILL